MNVLCIDDDPITLMLCKKVIEKVNFASNIFTSNNGEEALDFFNSLNQNNEFEDRIVFDTSIGTTTIQNLGLVEANVANKESARNSLAQVDAAINYINGARANYGALQSRLQSTSEYLMVAEENYAAANSRIRDTDMAEESAALAKNSILQQAAVSVLGQANTQQQLALKLLAG